MKVGVDSVILGAWIKNVQPKNILDVGTGCGILALMLAQKFPSSHITAVEIESDAAKQASQNFNNAPFSNSFVVENGDFNQFYSTTKFDLIVSNPPYFKEDSKQECTKRSLARMSKYLPLKNFLVSANNCLATNGSIYIIYPVEQLSDFNELLTEYSLYIHQQLTVLGNPNSKIKRYCFELKRKSTLVFSENPIRTELLIEYNRGNYTDEYKRLTQDFYLKF